MLSKISRLYSYSGRGRHVLHTHVKSEILGSYAEALSSLCSEVVNRYRDDQQLQSNIERLKRVFYRMCSTLKPYAEVLSHNEQMECLAELRFLKAGYSSLFDAKVQPLAKVLHEMLKNTNNDMVYAIRDCLREQSAPSTVALVTKRELSEEDISGLKLQLYPEVVVRNFSETAFRHIYKTYNEVIYVGNPEYFDSFASNTFKAEQTRFLCYEVFVNTLRQKQVFSDLSPNYKLDTVYTGIRIGTPLNRLRKVELPAEDSLDSAVQQLLREQSVETSDHIGSVEATTVLLGSNRFILVSDDCRIRMFCPNESRNTVQQVSLRELEEDDFIVIWNDSDNKLIADVADGEVLGIDAEELRKLQLRWKQRLRRNVQEKGISTVISILARRHELQSATPINVRNWCNPNSICPQELPKLLEALKFSHEEIGTIFQAMRRIQIAHRIAGRRITRQLIQEITSDMYRQVREEGYYTFESREFSGASFNIERIITIGNTRHTVLPHNLMKPFKLDF